MQWISVDKQLPNNGEQVVGMRSDGWWHKVMYSKTHGWTGDSGIAQAISHWCRVTRPATASTGPGKKQLQEVKAGERVFVVEQRDREQLRRNDDPVTYSVEISRIGRSYGYFIGRYGFELKFDRITGVSWHGRDDNSRLNGLGFDVYVTEQDYLQEQREFSERERLHARLGCSGSRVKLSPEQVSAIHEVLDSETLL